MKKYLKLNETGRNSICPLENERKLKDKTHVDLIRDNFNLIYIEKIMINYDQTFIYKKLYQYEFDM